MNNNQPFVILVESQLAENMGMAARAMMNCGLYNLRLVSPRENHLSDKGIAASSNAEEILEKAQVFNSTAEAIADLSFVVGTTARRRDQVKQVYSAERAATIISAQNAQGIKTGLMFGPERTGLHNDDICLCDAIINIPLNPQHCSLNLSQAVLLVGYEYYKTQINAPAEQLVVNRTQITSKDKILRFCEFLEQQLEDCGNFKLSEKRDRMVINLRNIFTRNQMTEQELNSLYGVINHLNKK